MDKKTKMLLGVGAVALIGYLVWKNNQPKMNAVGKGMTSKPIPLVNTHGQVVAYQTVVFLSPNGHWVSTFTDANGHSISEQQAANLIIT
jgi:hypothetical protein